MKYRMLAVSVCALLVAGTVGAQTFVGPPNNTFGGGSNYTFYADGLVFDVFSTVTLTAVDCYPNGAGDIVINLLDAAGTILQSTAPFTVLSGGVVTVPVGFTIAPGTGYQLDAQGTTTGGLFRNFGGTATYPYTAPGLLSITGPINGLAGFYYFFYNWQLGGSGPAATHETNDPVSTLDVNGATGTAFAAAQTTVCVGETFSLNSASTGGNYEVGVAFTGSVSGGIATTAGGQIVNLDITHPSAFYLNGGAAPSLVPHPGSFALPLSAPFALTGCAQQMVSDVGHPDGFQLSHAPELTAVAPTPGPQVLTLGDDDNVQMFLAGPPLCGTSVSFYGTTYFDFFVASNGGVTFTLGTNDFTATSGEWQAEMPRVGIQSDLEPNNFGTISVTNNGPAAGGDWITVAYQNVTEWGTTGMGVTSYNVELHGPNGHEIGGFMTDGTWGTSPVVGGMTNGLMGTHPALVSFDSLNGAGAQSSAAATDSVIDENTGGMLANTTGWTSIQFPGFDGSIYLVQ